MSSDTSPLRLLMVTGIFPPDRGGPPSYVPRMAAALSARGHRVEVICLSDRLDHDDSHLPFPVRRIRRSTFFPFRQNYRQAAAIALLLLLPTAYENWIRGSCSPALLRQGRSRDLMKMNALQALITLGTLALVVRQPLHIAVLAVGAARALPASINLVLLRSIVPGRKYLVPLEGVLIAVLAAFAGLAASHWLPAPETARFIAAGFTFTGLFYVGMRWVVLRDAGTLRLAHSVAGSRIKPLSRLLPALPLANS